MRAIASFLAFVLLSTSFLGARVFTDRNGRSFEGELIESSGATVKIRRLSDQQVFSISLEVLSQEDRDFIAQTTKIAPAANPPAPSPNFRLGRFIVTTADSRPQELRLRINYNHREVWAGSANSGAFIDVPIHVDTDFNEEPKKGYAKSDAIYLYIESRDYASQWHYLTRSGDKLSLQRNDQLKLHRKKYLVVEYAFYPGDDPNFEGREPLHSGVAALGHWGALPGFRHDWQVWQGDAKSISLWGDTLLLDFHRGTAENGIVMSRTSNFAQMQKAPTTGYVHHGACGAPKLAAKAGTAYFCRIVGHTASTRGYGKIYIREITDTVPAGVEVFTR